MPIGLKGFQVGHRKFGGIGLGDRQSEATRLKISAKLLGRRFKKSPLNDGSGIYKEKRKMLNEKGRKHYAANKEHLRKLRHEKHVRYRMECLIHYSDNPPFCNCCGEKTIEFLALDHIGGGGTRDRKQNGSNQYSKIRIGWPPLFQVLCHNCNMAKGFYGICPHVSLRV